MNTDRPYSRNPNLLEQEMKMNKKIKKMMALTAILMLAVCSIFAMVIVSDDSDASSVTKSWTVGSTYSYNTGLEDAGYIMGGYGCVIEGSVPPGISDSSTTGYLVFSGTPTSSGTFVTYVYQYADCQTGNETLYTTLTITFVISSGTTTESYSYTATLIYDAESGSNAPASQTATITSTSSTASGSKTFSVTSSTPTAPTGYVFVGWSQWPSTSSFHTAVVMTGGYAFSVDYGTSDTLYAVYEEEATSYTHVLNYQDDNGSTLIASETVTNTESVYTMTVSSTEPSKSGYVFDHWIKSGASATVIYPGETVQVSESYTLVAVWTAIQTYTVTYDLDGGTGTADSVTVTTGSEVTLPSEGITKDGYLFMGWHTDGDETVLDPGTVVTVIQDITYIASWADNTEPVASFVYSVEGYDVTFTDTSIAPNVWQWSFGDTTTSTSQNPTHTYGDTGTYSVTLSITNATEITSTYSAVITIGDGSASYTITFNTNDGEDIDTVTATSGSAITLPTAVKDGYVFGGWYYDGVLVGNGGSQYTVTGDITLSATWAAEGTVTYTVTFVCEGYTENTQTVLTGGYATTVILSYLGGPCVDTWYTDEGLTEEYNFNTAVTSDLTLYGKNTYEVPSGTSDNSAIVMVIGIVIGVLVAIALGVVAGIYGVGAGAVIVLLVMVWYLFL